MSYLHKPVQLEQRFSPAQWYAVAAFLLTTVTPGTLLAGRSLRRRSVYNTVIEVSNWGPMELYDLGTLVSGLGTGASIHWCPWCPDTPVFGLVVSTYMFTHPEFILCK